LLLDPASGIIIGTPTQAVDATLKLQVRDSAQAVASESFSLVVLSASTSASGNSYYVDSSGGDDSSNGTSASSPWRTIAKVNARNFSPGDHILLKRGDTWRELLALSSSGDAGNPIVVDAYGSGQLLLSLAPTWYPNRLGHSARAAAKMCGKRKYLRSRILSLSTARPAMRKHPFPPCLLPATGIRPRMSCMSTLR
jgi:hypothetical protein